jgi:uncharacterized protein (TIGR03435 family)
MKRITKALGQFKKISPEEVESAGTQALKYLGVEDGERILSKSRTSDAGHPGRRLQWPAIAAIAAAIVIAVLIPTRIVKSAPAILEDASGSRKIQYGEVVRPSGDTHAILAMSDGTRVEMPSQSEFSLERAEDGGTRIHLKKGSVADVAAISGEARVQQGATEVKLRPGEQVTSNPVQSAPPDIFDVVSIRRSPEVNGAGGGGARGAGGQQQGNRPTGGGPCRGRLQLDPSRFAATGAGVYFLVALAYGLDEGPFPCGIASKAGFLSGGPDWIQSANFDIEAGIPDGPPALIFDTDFQRVTVALANPSRQIPTTPRKPGPRLRNMVRAMLEDRFKIKLRREVKEMPVYVLSVANAGILNAYKQGDWAGSYVSVAGYEVIKNGIAPPKPYEGMLVGAIGGGRATMTQLAVQLSQMTGRPVLDQTNLPGYFTYEVFFAPGDYGRNTGHDQNMPDDPRPKLSSPSLFKVLEDELGLKLVEARERVDVFVVENVERPSEN